MYLCACKCYNTACNWCMVMIAVKILRPKLKSDSIFYHRLYPFVAKHLTLIKVIVAKLPGKCMQTGRVIGK